MKAALSLLAMSSRNSIWRSHSPPSTDANTLMQNRILRCSVFVPQHLPQQSTSLEGKDRAERCPDEHHRLGRSRGGGDESGTA